MDIRKLQRAIVDGLEDVKAQNIVVFNTEHLSPLFERVIIASGTSNRQTKSLASSVRETVKARGLEVMRTEGEENGDRRDQPVHRRILTGRTCSLPRPSAAAKSRPNVVGRARAAHIPVRRRRIKINLGKPGESGFRQN